MPVVIGIAPTEWRGPLWASVAKVLSGTIAAQIINFAVAPIVSRIYTPEQFGDFATVGAISALVITIGSLKYELAIPIAESEEDAAGLTRLCMYIGACVACFCAAVIYVAVYTLTIDLQNVGAGVASGFVGMLTMLGVAIQTAELRYVRANAYKALAWATVVQVIVQAVMQITLSSIISGPNGLLVGQVAGQTAALAWFLGWRKSCSAAATSGSTSEYKTLRMLAGKYARFPRYNFGAGLLNSAALQTPQLVVSAFFSPAVAGQFNLANRMIRLPVALVGKAVGSVYMGALSTRQYRSKNGKQIFVYFSGVLLAISFFAAAVLLFWGPDLFAGFFGPQWKMAGQIAAIMTPALMIILVASPLSQTLTIYGRQKTLLYWELWRFGVSTPILVVSGLLLGDILHLMWVLSAVSLVVYGVLVYLSYQAHTDGLYE